MKKLFNFLILSLLVGTFAVAGLPPTSSEISGDTSNKTTFNYQFPNFTGSHSGVTVNVPGYTVPSPVPSITTVVLGSSGGPSPTPSWSPFSALSNPMNGQSQMIYGAAGGTPAVVPSGTPGQVLAMSSPQPSPSPYASPSPVFQTLAGNSNLLVPPGFTTLSSMGSTAGYLFTITGVTGVIAPNCVFTNNGNSYTTIVFTLSLQTLVWMSNASAPTATGTLTYSSGGSGTNPCGGTSGTYGVNLTYSAETAYAAIALPTNPSPLYLDVRACGGGGGGGGGGGSGVGGTGGTGGTTYPSPGYNATGGTGGTGGSQYGGAAGTSGTANVNPFAGNAASPGETCDTSLNYCSGGTGGGNAFFAGAGQGGQNGNVGSSGVQGGGGGGGGGGAGSDASGGGGGGPGGCTLLFISGTAGNGSLGALNGSFPYILGAQGSAGSAGTAGHAGATGGLGIITIEPHFQ